MSLKPTFVPLVKPEGYVPTPRATVASTFKPALVCAVRNRVTPQPRPPYLPQPVSLEGLNVVANFIDTETGAASVEYLHVVANFVDAITSSASIEKMSVVVVVVDTYP